MRAALAFIALALAMPAAPAVAQEADCDILPEQVERHAAYAGYSASDLCAAGQGPLWNGLPPEVLRVTRFVFSDGHAAFYRYVTITERVDGSAGLETGGAETPYRREHERLDRRRFGLSPEKRAELAQLMQEAGAFEFEVGTWDGEEIYLHCQLLEMERADAEGYRFSSVNIGCNQPQRLMPLVNEVIRLADLDRVTEGWNGRPSS